MQKIDKRGKLWIKIRKQWVIENPPDFQGYYCCGICSHTVHKDDMEIDHIDGRVGDKFYDTDNFQPTHSLCNRMKGSQKWIPKVSKEEYRLRKELDL